MRDSIAADRQRIRSLSVDSTTTQAAHDAAAAENCDQFNTFMNAAADAAHDFRRKPSRQNSYIEAVKQIGGKCVWGSKLFRTYFFYHKFL